MTAATLNFETEGLRAIDFSLSEALADVRISGFNIDEAQIEPLLRYSMVVGTEKVPAKRVETKPRGMRLPWKKAPALYQVTPFLTVALATTAFVFPRMARGTPVTGVTRTPIYHFALPDNEGADFVSPESLSVALENELEDLILWPSPSTRPTTVASARTLHSATSEDPYPTTPPLMIDDGMGP